MSKPARRRAPYNPRKPPTNAFARWMDRPSAPRTVDIAAALGVAPCTVLNYRRGVYRPGRAMAVAIAELTAGAVPVESWDP